QNQQGKDWNKSSQGNRQGSAGNQQGGQGGQQSGQPGQGRQIDDNQDDLGRDANDRNKLRKDNEKSVNHGMYAYLRSSILTRPAALLPAVRDAARSASNAARFERCSAPLGAQTRAPPSPART